MPYEPATDQAALAAAIVTANRGYIPPTSVNADGAHSAGANQPYHRIWGNGDTYRVNELSQNW